MQSALDSEEWLTEALQYPMTAEISKDIRTQM